MSGEEIKFTITPKGIKIETSGFVGGSCLSTLEDFKAFMLTKGVKITETHQETKPELYETEQTRMKNEY